MRITQLGADRNGWRYWLFDRQICPGLFVEKFDPTEDNKKSEWRCYTTSSKVDQLLSALHPKGMNEAKLRVELQRKLKEIRGNLADFQPLPTAKDLIKSSRPIDQQPTFADKLKRQLVDLNTELKQAALGGLADFDSLQISTENADKLRDLASIIEAIFQSVPPQMFTGWLKKPLEEIIKLEARQYNVQAGAKPMQKI